MKPEFEFFAADTIGWTPAGNGLRERILARYGDSDVCTRMLEFAPGVVTDATLTHTFWEEVWIVSGAITDLRLDQTFTAGMYACRPPGMEHGPWASPDGCTTFEVRYPVREDER